MVSRSRGQKDCEDGDERSRRCLDWYSPQRGTHRRVWADNRDTSFPRLRSIRASAGTTGLPSTCNRSPAIAAGCSSNSPAALRENCADRRKTPKMAFDSEYARKVTREGNRAYYKPIRATSSRTFSNTCAGTEARQCPKLSSLAAGCDGILRA